MYTGPGERTEVVAVREVGHGEPCCVGALVGFAAKIDQLDRFVRPSDPEATTIAVGEEFQLFLTGVHELPLAGPIAGAANLVRVFINTTNDALALAGGANMVPLGVIQSIDAARNPDVARLNMNVWQAFELGEA